MKVVFDIDLKSEFFLLFSLFLFLFISFIAFFDIIYKSYCIISVTF